jgi:DNA-directed RNA polymerase II subunit RPB2
VLTPGELLFELFKTQYKTMMTECNKQFVARTDSDVHSNEPFNMIHQIKDGSFEQGMKTSLMRGAWQRRQGVSQMLQRMSYMQILTFLTRIDSQSGDKSGIKLTKPRHVDPSSVGFLCVSQTPEHSGVGLTKHLSMIGSITVSNRENYEIIKEYIQNTEDVVPISSICPEEIQYMYKVFLNGEWMGLIKNNHPVNCTIEDNPVMKMFIDARNKKLNGFFNKMSTSITIDHTDGELRFYCDSGRLYRPVFRVGVDNKMIITKELISKISLDKSQYDMITDWEQLVAHDTYPIEFIDTEEQPYLMIADKINTLQTHRQKILDSEKFQFEGAETQVVNRYDDKFFLRYDHCEMHGSCLLGEIVTNIPFSERNFCLRNIFQYSQGRQAMGIYTTTYRNRLDISYILYHPQRPLVSTRTAKYTNTDILPQGENVIVAIMCYGYNQED